MKISAHLEGWVGSAKAEIRKGFPSGKDQEGTGAHLGQQRPKKEHLGLTFRGERTDWLCQLLRPPKPPYQKLSGCHPGPPAPALGNSASITLATQAVLLPSPPMDFPHVPTIQLLN